MRNQRSIFKNIDWITISIYLALAFIGWISIYAAVYNEENNAIFDVSQRYGSQLIWMIFAFIIAFVILLLDGNFFTSLALPIYGVLLIILVGVLLFGVKVNGATSWFEMGSIKIQPAEFAKFATVLALAKYLSMPNIRIKEFKTKVIATTIIAVPALLILLQNDTGSTLTYAAFIFVLYREGLSGNILLFGVLAILVFVLTLVFGPTAMIIFGFVVYALFYTAIKYDLKATVFSLLGIIAFFIFYSFYEIKDTFIFYGIAAIIAFITLFIVTNKKLKDKGSHYLGVFIFVISCAYIYSIDFAFNKVLKEHQRTRITVLLGEEDQLKAQISTLELKLNDETYTDDAQRAITKTDLKAKKESLKELQQGNGWNIKQSLIAIGSGGFAGKGFLNGTQTKFNFVPEQSTDFIFCTIGEEWGFLGTSFIVVLYIGLFLRIIFLAEKQRSTFSRIYGYGVAAILFIHFLVNLGMTIGLVPVIGIPLPFISYGGSSLWSFTILLFIFIKLDSERLLVLR